MKTAADHKLGSPGVRLTNTPSGHACLRPALHLTSVYFGRAREDNTPHNSVKRCCLRTDGRLANDSVVIAGVATDY